MRPSRSCYSASVARRFDVQREDSSVANLARDPLAQDAEETIMTLSTILIIVLILLLIGALPTWGYSRSWGYRPMGGLGVILIIVIVLLLLGVI